MKVKIGSKTYDSTIEPIMIVLSEQDKKNIAIMLPSATKYCSFPSEMDFDKVEKWMDE